MRVGVLADVHANLPALDAVLERLDVDAFVCAGDVVGYGPHPNECVERVASLRATCVAGNHDLIALGRLGDDRCVRLARVTLAWTASALGAEARAWLGALPRSATGPGGIAVAHGSPGDPQEYVRTAERARQVLADDLLVLGHTHMPWAWGERSGDALRGDATGAVELGEERWLLNPGSVGQSRTRDPSARAVVLDLDARRAEFLAVEYDAEATRRALRAQGLPENACHMPPAPLPRRVAGRVLRTLRR